MKLFKLFILCLLVTAISLLPTAISKTADGHSVPKSRNVAYAMEKPITGDSRSLEKLPVSCHDYLKELSKYNWDVNVASAIMRAESNCRADANNAGTNRDGSVDYGVMQINSIHADMVNGNLDSLYDAKTNIAVAYRIYSGRGWAAWSTYNNGAYLQYMN